MKAYGLVMFAVTELVVTIFVLMFLGRWADSYFQAGSRYLVAGALFGFILGVYRMYWRLKGVMGDDDSDAGTGGSGPAGQGS